MVVVQALSEQTQKQNVFFVKKFLSEHFKKSFSVFVMSQKEKKVVNAFFNKTQKMNNIY